MHISTIALTALASAGAAQLVLPLGPYSGRIKAASTADSKYYHVAPEIQFQRPLSGHGHKPAHSTADLPAYKHGQHMLVEQDGSVCPSYGEKQWTGTIDVTDTRRLFFWAFESRNDPANDPVLFWMNGGPGSSSMMGAFTDILDAYKTPTFADDGKHIGDIRIMALNGNLDASINTHGNMALFERIVWSRMGEYRVAEWQDLDEEEVKGTGSWKGTKDGRLVFMAVDDAGHMLPGDVPEASYHILQRWLRNEWR